MPGVDLKVCAGMSYGWKGWPHWRMVYYSNELCTDAMSIQTEQAPR
jgi:hypothetical protein